MGLLSLLLPHLLLAEIFTSAISSKKASYDGNALVLKGKVELQHTLGKMESGFARLEKESKEGPFASIHLKENVFLTLKNQGTILCESASFDFNDLTGKIFPKKGDSIHFDHFSDGLLSLTSKTAQIELTKEWENIQIAKIEAKEDVHLTYGDNFSLVATSAIYSPSHGEELSESDKNAKIVLLTPKGNFISSRFSKDSSIQFSCDRMIWQQLPKRLLLQGNVAVHDEIMGDIQCDDEIEVHQIQQEGKWVLDTIEAKGTTCVTYPQQGNCNHFLICHKTMRLDQQRLVLTMESPKDAPIEYFHDPMKLFAEQAKIDYVQEGPAIHPQKILLYGNVRLESDATQNEKRCALADQFVYFPQEQKMILSSQDDQNVLFWDEEKELSISAKEVHISHNENEDMVKGVGNVHFAFSSAENQLLKKLFPFYQPKSKPHE